MLLATYALTTLTVEQKGKQSSLDALQTRMMGPLPDHARDTLVVQIEQLIRLAELRHRRRWENSLAPALRAVCAEARPRLEALDHLGRIGARMLPALMDSVGAAAASSVAPLEGMRLCLAEYCQNLRLRLSCEDELVRMALATLPLHAWARIGEEFLSQDAERTA